MLPFFKVLKGLIDIDVSHFVDFCVITILLDIMII